MTFACLDFETANYDNESICAAGLAVFVDGDLTESLYWRPPAGPPSGAGRPGRPFRPIPNTLAPPMKPQPRPTHRSSAKTKENQMTTDFTDYADKTKH